MERAAGATGRLHPFPETYFGTRRFSESESNTTTL